MKKITKIITMCPSCHEVGTFQYTDTDYIGIDKLSDTIRYDEGLDLFVCTVCGSQTQIVRKGE